MLTRGDRKHLSEFGLAARLEAGRRLAAASAFAVRVVLAGLHRFGLAVPVVRPPRPGALAAARREFLEPSEKVTQA